jgi:hypothetical protein
MVSTRAVNVRRQLPNNGKAADMHQLRRIQLTYYVRVAIPKARRGDFGGKTEVVRTLQTRDHKEALARRSKAVTAIREELNRSLGDRGLPQLDSVWVPDWQHEALAARAELATASDEPLWYEEDGQPGPSDKDAKRSIVFDAAEDLAGSKSPKEVRQFLEVALGDITPIRITADRWLRDVSGPLAG